MIEVIHYQNKGYELSFEPVISASLDEARELLPELPANIKIYFSDYGILEDSGIGGYAYSRNIITISLDSDFSDKDLIHHYELDIDGIRNVALRSLAARGERT